VTRQKPNSGMLLKNAVLSAAAAVLCAGLAGCGGGESTMPSLPGVSSLFAEKEEILPGRRVSVLQNGATGLAAAETITTPVLPPPQLNASWTEPGGNASNSPGHLALGDTFNQPWATSVGTGSSKSGRLTAIPIVADGKIFTLDVEGNISAVSASNGATVWNVNIRPAKQAEQGGYGGGLAYEGGRIFGVTGYGSVVALDAATGKAAWSKELAVPFRMSPTVANGRVYAVNADSELHVFNTMDGSELWTARGLPETAGMLSNASPAVSGNLVVVPYPSGEVVALDVNTGRPRWSESISRGGANGTKYAAISTAARPVIDGNAVFSASRAGSVIATSKDSGERLWHRELTAVYAPAVSGDTVFVADTANRVLALSRKDGKVRWIAQLSHTRWIGPVLANNKLFMISENGDLQAVDVSNGNVTRVANLDTSVSLPPVVANGKLYILSDKARLYAMN
jgi:outer membrane protein assembly factor BamB